MSQLDPEAPVIVALSQTDLGAALVASILDAEGIRAMVAGSHSPAGLPIAPLASIGSTVLVRRADHALATETLRAASAQATEKRFESMRSCYSCGYPRDSVPAREPCPECGADQDGFRATMGQWKLVEDRPASGIVPFLGITAGVLGLAVLLAGVAMLVFHAFRAATSGTP